MSHVLRTRNSHRDLGGEHFWLWPLINHLVTTQTSWATTWQYALKHSLFQSTLATTHNTLVLCLLSSHFLQNVKIWFRFAILELVISWHFITHDWLMFVLCGCFSWAQAVRRPRLEWVLGIGWCPSLMLTQRRWPMWRHRTRSEPQPTPSLSLWAGTSHTHHLLHRLWVSVSQGERMTSQEIAFFG